MALNLIGNTPAWFIREITPIKVLLAQTRNQQLYNGQFVNFVIVPFQDGTMPDQNHLPPLTTAAVISGLNPAQATSYAQGYGLGHIASVDERRRAIGRAVGCSVDI